MRSMSVVLENAGEGGVDAAPLRLEQREDAAAVRGEAIEPFLPLVFFAPLAREQALALEPAEQRVQSAFVDRQASLGERLPEGVAVMLAAELPEHGQHE